jgi:ParB-like chromosome segregation protein Spo0J
MRRKKTAGASVRKRRQQKSKTRDSAGTDLRHINRAFKPHDIALTFPPLDDIELQELMRDIAEHGQREAITLYEDKILDGWHRYQACRRVGVTPFYREFKGDLEGAIAYARSLNYHRRHLTAEQRRELIAKLIKATPEKSDRQIAETVKASPTTVGTVRAEMEAKGEVSKLDTRIDRKGVEQPARKPRLPTLAEQRAALSREAQQAHALIDLPVVIEERANEIISALVDLAFDDGMIAESDEMVAAVVDLLRANPDGRTLQLARRGIALVHFIEAALDPQAKPN